MNTDDKKSALKVNDGIEQPNSISDDAVNKYKAKRKTLLNKSDYVSCILKGDITTLSRAITLVESNLPEHQEMAQEIIENCMPYSGKSIRIGITGVPGVGKSTFIETLGIKLTDAGRKLAVLAIDPSSQLSKGSILGDKTRMEKLSVHSNAFIRPSPSAGTLGGVARKTRESIILCEAAGFDTIFIETVGVGQSETMVHSMVDFFLLLMLSGGGDELQGIKRGIMEMVDAIFINKADGDNLLKAQTAKAEYSNALHLLRPTESGWKPVVDTCSSRTSEGIDNVWNIIMNYVNFTKLNGFFETKRIEQGKLRLYEAINQQLKDSFYQNENVKKLLPEMENDLNLSKTTAYKAAHKLFDTYFSNIKKNKR